MKKLALVTLALACASFSLGAAAAVQETSSLDVYYVPQAKLKIEVPGLGTADSDGGTGFGVKGFFMLNPSVFATAEYQANRYDGFNGVKSSSDVDELRFGVGFRDPSGLFGAAELVNLKQKSGGTDNSDTGYGVHAGFMGELVPQVQLSADVGYLDVGDSGKGLEFRVGGAFLITSQYGLFADFRQTELKDKSDTKATLSDIRIGARLRF